MPTVNLSKESVKSKLGKLSDQEFSDICFNFGLEVDEITSEYDMVMKEQGEKKAENCSKDVIYKVDIPANRYDLLCVEGLTRALMIFEGKIGTPRYIRSLKNASVIMKVTATTQLVRPYAVAAILRGINFTKSSYDSFIDLQEKLHQSIGKKRSVVSIGTHDFDTVEGPFTYDARPPADISFVPLNEKEVFTAEGLMEHYSKESHLKSYLPIIRDSAVYPLMVDSRGTVLSLPPIINGDHTKIQLSTKNVFIEITATNLHKASIALDTMVSMFSEYCSRPFEIEPVDVQSPDGSVHQYPKLLYRKESVSVDYINKMIGCSLQGHEMATLLDKMSLKAEVLGNVLSVEVPPTRYDVLHRCDIMEDVAIAFGYSNITECLPILSKDVRGGIQPLNKLTHDLRLELVKNQFTEVLSFALCSKNEISSNLGIKIEDTGAVHIGNPKTKEFQVCRTTLLPGLLSTALGNQHLPLPLRIFEVQDVVVKDVAYDVRARNERRLCALNYGMGPDFEDMVEVLHGVMASLGYSYRYPMKAEHVGKVYSLEDVCDTSLMNGRSFCVRLGDGVDIGRLGIVHPDVMVAFNFKKGLASVLEVKIEHFE